MDKERYSVLRPLSVEEQELFAIEIINFFFPLNYFKNCEILGIKAEKQSTRPFTFFDFQSYLQKRHDINAFKYNNHLLRMIQRGIQSALLINAGYTLNGSPPLNHCYYSLIELTEIQRKNNFWLGKILGEEFLMEKYKSFIIRFEGEYESGEAGTGSGILINNNTILTCKHVLIDLTKYRCFLKDDELIIKEHKVHNTHDIGIVKLNNDIDLKQIPYFGNPYILDNILTMGYPPLRGMREAVLITQKGEINAISKDWQKCDCITISSTVRPGNSGGPVISSNGYIVGIVTQSANSTKSASTDKDTFQENHSIPFYNAIASTSIIKILTEIDESIPILYENYQ